MMVLAVLTALAEQFWRAPCPPFACHTKIQHDKATVAALTVLAVMAVSVMTATPLKLNPPFP